jgi:hypothetical protein
MAASEGLGGLDVHHVGPFAGVAAREQHRIAEGGRTSALEGVLTARGVSRLAGSVDVHATHDSAVAVLDETALNPQPLPPGGVPERGAALRVANELRLRGVAAVFAVPGFAEAPIALARMVDGSVLVLDRSSDGTARVAGTFAGPIGSLEVAGAWAMAPTAGQSLAFRLTRG